METDMNIPQRSQRKHIQIKRPQAAFTTESQQPAPQHCRPERETAKPQYIQGLPAWDLLPPRGVVRRYHK